MNADGWLGELLRHLNVSTGEKTVGRSLTNDG